MDLQSFKTSIQQLTDDELHDLLADIRTRRIPVTDLTTIKERAKPKARSANSGKTSVASLKGMLSQDQLKMLIAKLQEG